jgi:hypothetical protein
MVTRQALRSRIEDFLEGLLTLEDLAAWAEQAFRDDEFEPDHADRIETILSILRDATDPHRFRWEEPDWDGMLEQLDE